MSFAAVLKAAQAAPPIKQVLRT